MNTKTRNKLAMGTSALNFLQKNPSQDASYNAQVTHLGELDAEADQLAQQERDGILEQGAAVLRRDELRRNLRDQTLRHAVRTAEAAARTQPELAGKFVLPPATGPNRAFIAAAKGILAATIAAKDVLISKGLGDTFLDEFTAQVAQYDVATKAAHDARTAHVGACARLGAIGTEVVVTVGVLDGLVRARFRGDEELLAAWKSASNVFGPARSRTPVAPTPPTDGAPVTPAPEGMDKAA